MNEALSTSRNMYRDPSAGGGAQTASGGNPIPSLNLIRKVFSRYLALPEAIVEPASFGNPCYLFAILLRT